MKTLSKLVDDPKGQRFLIALLVLFLGAAMFGWSQEIAHEPGFPIDDAWIFQVFARNLAQAHQVAFNVQVPATGVSSWLWFLLLTPGYWLPISPFLWSHMLTLLGTIAVGWTVLELGSLFIPGPLSRRWGLLAAVLTVCEWHIMWSSLGGMETPLFTWLSLLLVFLYKRERPLWMQGVVGGLLIVTRVEGILLVGLVWLWNLKRNTWRGQVVLALTTVLITLPMFGVNWSVGGMFLPNTWAAKGLTIHQPEAGIVFLGEYVFMLLLGLNVLLVPTILFFLHASRSQIRQFALPIAWVLLLLCVYVFTFPIAYHHLRYMMPTLPWWILFGVSGTAMLWQKNRAVGWMQLGITAVFAAGMVGFGANVYAWNVQNINGQHVAVGKWLESHTPTDTVVAAEDIGGIGYFSHRQVVDIQGLVTPEVLPLLRAGQSLTPFLCSQSVKFLAVYPHVFARFADGFEPEPVFRAHLNLNTINPDVNLDVYQAKACAH